MVLGPYMLLIASVVLVGCSGPRPILYPNDHLKTVGQERAEQDIAECEESAKAAGANAEQGKTEQTFFRGQPAVARFNRNQYAKAKELSAEKGLHIMDALSEVGLNDSAMMRALKRTEMGRR